MGIQSIKSEFLNYLSRMNEEIDENSTPKYNTEAGDMCIQLYASEFKEFLSSNNYADSSILNKTVTEILSMDFENGRFVENDEENSDSFESESKDEQSSDPVSQLNQEEMLEFISAVDSGMALMPAPVSEPVLIGADPLPDSISTSSKTVTSAESDLSPLSVSSDTTKDSGNTETEQFVYDNSKSTYSDDVQSKLDEIYNSPEAIEYLDIDGDGKLSDGEKLLFEKYVQGNNENITTEDLQKAFDSIKNGKFDYDPMSVTFTSPTGPTEATTPTEPTQQTEDPTQQMMEQMQQMMQQMQQMQQAQSAGGGGGGGGGSYTSSSSKKSNTIKEKTLDTMSRDELEAEKTSAAGKLSDQQSNLDSIMDDENGPLAGQKKNVDDMYGEYQTALKEVAPELAEQLDSVVGEISTQEEAIDKQEVALTNQEVAVSAAKNSFDNAKATQAQAQASLNELNAVDQSELDDEQKATLQDKIDAANKALENANNAVSEAEQTYNTAQEMLLSQQEALDKMKGQEGLGALQARKEVIEQQIAEQHPEMVDLQNKYNSAKQNYDKDKEKMVSDAKTDILNAQNYINEINTAINNLENKQLKKDLSFSKNGEIFGSNIDKAAEYVDDGEHMPYMVIGPKDPDPNKEYPVVVYLHGDYQTGGGKGIMDETMPGVFMDGQLPEDFDGYIICPQLTGSYYCNGNWQNDQAEAAVRGVIENFSQSHNIDEDKIALTGGSRGGMGVEYMAKHMPDIFCKAVAISSYPTGIDLNDIPIPIIGMVGKYDGSSSSYMQSVYDQLIWLEADHSNSPYAAFHIDSDGDGRADIYQWLFGD